MKKSTKLVGANLGRETSQKIREHNQSPHSSPSLRGGKLKKLCSSFPFCSLALVPTIRIFRTRRISLYCVYCIVHGKKELLERVFTFTGMIKFRTRYQSSSTNAAFHLFINHLLFQFKQKVHNSA
jgi:hypothetical protein